MYIEHIFVINLKHRTDRWNIINDKLSKLNLKIKKWDAICGKNLNEDEIKNVTTNFCNMFCSSGMIGCWLSHYNLWKHIVQNNLNNVLILEDDAEPTQLFIKEKDNLINHIPLNYDILYFGYFNFCDDITNLFPSLKNKNNDFIIKPTFPLGLHAYMLSNKGATKLLICKDLEKVSYHVDFSLSWEIFNNKNNFNIFAFKEPLFVQTNSKSNLMSHTHPICDKVITKLNLNSNITNHIALYNRNSDLFLTPFTLTLLIISLLLGASTQQFSIIFLFIFVIIFLLEIHKTNEIKNGIFEIILLIFFNVIGHLLKNN